MTTTLSPVRELKQYNPLDIINAMQKTLVASHIPRMTSAQIKYFRRHFEQLLGSLSKPDMEKILHYLRTHHETIPIRENPGFVHHAVSRRKIQLY